MQECLEDKAALTRSYCCLGRSCPSAAGLGPCNFSLSSLSSKIRSRAVLGRIMQMGFTLLMLRPATAVRLTDSSSQGSLVYLCSDYLSVVGVL